jgi:lipoprotein YgeR
VKAGQKIGTMGSTGTDSVFLHFQIRYRATALDPQRYLPPQGASPPC